MKCINERFFSYLHSDNTVIIVTCNMEPCTRINKSGIPTLQDIVSIFQALPQAVKSITCGQNITLSSTSILPVKMEILAIASFYTSILVKKEVSGKEKQRDQIYQTDKVRKYVLNSQQYLKGQNTNGLFSTISPLIASTTRCLVFSIHGNTLGMHPIELYCSITISIINNSRKTER